MAHLALVERFRFDGEEGRLADEHLHWAGRALCSLRVVRCARVAAAVSLIDAREEQRPVVHDDDVLGLVWFEQTAFLGPRDVLQRRIRLDVALHYATQAKRQVLHRGRERHLGRICDKEVAGDKSQECSAPWSPG